MTLAKSLQAAAGNSMLPNYIEDVFSTYLYTGNGSTQTINNGIDLAGEGGLVWTKPRLDANRHDLVDTVRGAGNALASEYTNGTMVDVDGVTGFNGTGYTLGPDGNYNGSWANNTYVSWTFRKQPKFFDVVTYTGEGNPNAPRQIAHSLGSAPGFMIIKATSTSSDWYVWARTSDTTAATGLSLNSTAAAVVNTGIGRPTATYFDTSTIFDATAQNYPNQTGVTYVAYLFAHDAGGFGESGEENVVSCGSFTTDGSGNATVNLGYEPQWMLVKRTDVANTWWMMDTMRGWTANTGNNFRYLQAQDAGAEGAAGTIQPTATGFTVAGNNFGASGTFIYIAIRRGPMKVPTDGTKVYQANTYTGNATNNTTVAGNFGFPVDLLSLSSRSADAVGWSTYGQMMLDRLRGDSGLLATASTAAESFDWSQYNAFDVQNSIGWGLYGTSSGAGYMNNSGGTFVARGLQRAPGFFDEVCYTGTGVATTVAHNLGVAPELMIVKQRSPNISNWWIYHSELTATKYVALNLTAASAASSTIWANSSPTPTDFTVGTASTNTSGALLVAYLFASCPGVSKVGSYTGNGTTQTIPCGFAAGARFVMIKRTDSTGDWYVWDSARGIVAGNDPHLSLNSTAAEVTTDDSVDVDSTGFIVNQLAATNINVTSASYIFLAIA